MKKLIVILLLLSASPALAQNEIGRQKGKATYLTFCIRNSATGACITSASPTCYYEPFSDSTAPSGTWTDVSATETEFDSSGVYYVTLSSTVTNSDYAMLRCTSASSNAIPFVATLNTTKDLRGPYKVAQAGASTTIQLAAAESFADDLLNDNTSVAIVAGTGAGQVRCITDWVSSTDTATVSTWTTNPDNTSVYALLETPNCAGGSGASAADVWAYGSRALTDKSGFALSGTQTFNVTGNITGNLSGSVGSVTSVTDKTGYTAACTLGTDAVTAASISAAAGSKLADIVLRRTTANVEASSFGDIVDHKSLLGAVSQQTHRVAIVGDTFSVFKSDGATVLGSRTVTSSSSAAPITGIGN